MTTEIDRLLVRVEANAQQFEAAMRKLNRTLYGTQAETRKTLDRMKRDFDRAGQDMAQSFQPVQAAAQLAFAGITAYSIRAAGDAAEIRNAFDVAFGAGSDSAREFADTLADRVGRSTTQVQQQMTQLRLVLDGLGLSGEQADRVVRSLSERAIDIGSLFNVQDADAFRAIISGISGETEPMKRFGVVVNQAAVEAELLRLGFQGSASDASEAAKAIARTNIILERTAVANGDAARTAESTNNQFKRARSEFYEAAIVLGNQLLPAVTELTKAASDALEAFTELPEGVQIAGLAMLGLAAAAGPIAAVVTGLARVVTWAGRARAALVGVTGASAAAGAAGGAAAGGAAGLAARALPAVGVGLGVSSFANRPDAPTDAEMLAFRRAQLDNQIRRNAGEAVITATRREIATLEARIAQSERLRADLQGIADFAAGNWENGVDPIAGFGGFGLDGVAPGGGRGSGRSSDAEERRLEREREQLAIAQKEKIVAEEQRVIEEQLAELAKAKEEADREGLRLREAQLAATEKLKDEDARQVEDLQRAREAFRDDFVNSIRAAIDGDVGRAFEGLADRFTDRLLENAADGLFDVIFGGRGGGKGGGGNLLTSVFGSLFGGGRAMGGPVKAGMIYRVNENTPNSEFFSPGVDGSIIPRLKGMSIPQGGGRQVIEHRITVTPERDSFIRLSADTATPIAAQAGQVAFGGARQAVPADLARRDAYRRG